MELRHLHAFIAVAEELHFGRAAERQCIAQPALSRQIQHLERELGVMLFERGHQRVALTEAGQTLLHRLRPILTQLAEALEAAQEAGRGNRGVLRVGFTAATMSSRLPQMIRAVQARLPDAEVTFTEVYSGRQAEELREHRIDAGFALCVGSEPGLRVETLWTEPLIAVVPRSHPLARQGEVTLMQLATESLLLFPRALGPHLYDRIVALCRNAGFEPHLGPESAPQRTIIARVGAGAGVSLVPASLQDVQDPEAAYLPLHSPAPSVEFVALWREHDHSPLLHRFLEIVREVGHKGP